MRGLGGRRSEVKGGRSVYYGRVCMGGVMVHEDILFFEFSMNFSDLV